MQKEEDESSFYADNIFSSIVQFLPYLKWRELFGCTFKAKFLLDVKHKKSSGKLNGKKVDFLIVQGKQIEP